MSIIQVKGSGKNVAADRTSFMGVSIPKEILNMVKHAKKIEKSVFKRILQGAVMALGGESQEASKAWQSLEPDTENEEALAVVYCGLHQLLLSALRTPKHLLKTEHFVEDLKEIHLPESLIPEIQAVVFGTRRDKLDKIAKDNSPHFPTLDRCNWRVDVAISTSVLNRVLEPTVLMEMTLSDGSIKQFEVPVSKFHQLRYSVAQTLKEMSDLERRSILKVQDQH